MEAGRESIDLDWLPVFTVSPCSECLQLQTELCWGRKYLKAPSLLLSQDHLGFIFVPPFKKNFIKRGFV